MKIVLVACLAIAALGACSSNGSDTNASTTTTTQTVAPVGVGPACTLVGQADADAFFGSPAMQLQSGSSEGESSSCFWTADSGGGPGILLQIRVFDDDTRYAIKEFPTARPIAGLGEKAFVGVGPAGSTIDVQFVKSGKTYTVHYSVANVVNTDKGASSVDRSAALVAMLKSNAARV